MGGCQLWTASRVFGALSPGIVGFLVESVGIRRSFSHLAAATLVAALFLALPFHDRVYLDGEGVVTASVDD